MVNFADAVTKVSYGSLKTTTPNAQGVERFLRNVVKESQFHSNALHEIDSMNLKSKKMLAEKSMRPLEIAKKILGKNTMIASFLVQDMSFGAGFPLRVFKDASSAEKKFIKNLDLSKLI